MRRWNELKSGRITPVGLLAFAGFVVIAACSATQPQVTPPTSAAGVKAGGEPRELLYALGGSFRTRHPFIEVFNAHDKSQQPKPLYTIAPRGGGEYVLLSVDSTNQLYAVNYFANGSELDIFPSGSAKPTVSCLLGHNLGGDSLTGNAFYTTRFKQYRIDEYALPIRAGRDCPKPSRIFTDQRAALRGRDGLFGVALSPQNALFDTWETSGGMGKIDEFPPDAGQARRFRSLGQSVPDFITSDSSGNLITDVFGYYNGESGQSVNLGVMARGSKKIKLFATQGEGVYWAAALGADERELFVSTDYPAETVQVYAYDAQGAAIGKLLRTYDVSWIEDGTIAVFPGK
ncbi:MAG: hypothetical protein WBE83_04695 [Candidatus Cybelea sp.]